MGRVGRGYHPDRVAHARVTCDAIHGRKAWKLGDAFSSRFAGVLSRYAPHQSRYFLTRLWVIHSSHTRVLKWFFLGFQHPKPVRRGTSGRAPIRRSYASLLVSDARIFPRHAHPRGRRRLPRVPRAPTPSTNRAHSQVRDPPVGCGMRRARGRARLLRRRAGSRGATQRKLRDTRGHRRRLPRGCVHVHEIQPALTTIAPTTPPKCVKPPTGDKDPNATSSLTILPPVLLHLHPRRRRHRLIIPVPTTAQRDMPHHPVLRARRREGHPGWTRR